MRTRKVRKFEGWAVLGTMLLLAFVAFVGIAARVSSEIAEKGWVKTLNAVGPETSITVLAIIISFYAIYAQMREAHRINKFNQAVVTTMHCNSRYDEIVRDQPPNIFPRYAKNADRQAGRKHWRRYWGLKADQFDLYLTGLVDHDTMASWQLSTLRHFLRQLGPEGTDRAPGGINAIDSWVQLGKSQNEANRWFCEMIEKWLGKAIEFSELAPEDQAKQDLLLYVVEQLEIIEPFVESWNRSAHHGNMPLAFYKASLEWKLFPKTPYTGENLKRLAKLKNGIAISPVE